MRFADDSRSISVTGSTFRDNAGHGLQVTSSTLDAPPINDCTFDDNGGYGALIEGVKLISITGNAGAGNATNALGVSGTVASSGSWATGDPDFPFVLTGDVTVADGHTLTIGEDTVVKASPDTGLDVFGALVIDAHVFFPAIFTSIRDDDFGGDTEGDGGATLPAPGDWNGIFVDGSGNNDGIGRFDGCFVRYGGSATGPVMANLYFREASSSSFFRHSLSELSNLYGLWLDDSSLPFRMTWSRFNDSYGLYLTGTSAPDLGPNNPADRGHNYIHTNDSGGFDIYNDTANAIDAYFNIWNHDTEAEIDGQIFDDDEDPAKGPVAVGGHRLNVIFTDGFESGDFDAWSSVSGG